MNADDAGASLADTDGPELIDESCSPVHWPTLTAEEVQLEWPALREWVDQLLDRFPHCVRVPTCWWRHNDLVELFSALRDHERASFASTAPASAAAEWHRAFRDVELRAEMWIKRFTCTIPGREHRVSSEDWAAFVAADVNARTLTAPDNS
jgi:hypothetical protein